MENKMWKYKIGGDKRGLAISLFLFALFAGLSFWLYKTENGVLPISLLLTAAVLVVSLCVLYRASFVYVLVGETGFYHRTNPKKGVYYRYEEIAQAWVSAGKAANGEISSYFTYQTKNGRTVKFLFWPPDVEGIAYLFFHINGEEWKAEDENEDAGEY